MAETEIFVIDDSTADYDTLKRGFKQLDIDATLVHIVDCDSALKNLEVRRNHLDPFPQCIFLDLNLPGTSGLELLDVLKHDKDFAHIPVFILSTSNYEKDIQKSYHLGANLYLQKPVKYESVLEMVQLFKQFILETAKLPTQSQSRDS